MGRCTRVSFDTANLDWRAEPCWVCFQRRVLSLELVFSGADGTTADEVQRADIWKTLRIVFYAAADRFEIFWVVVD